MEWLSENWAWALFLGAFVAMHMFGHGGHGGHGDGDGDNSPDKEGKQRAWNQGSDHQH